MEVNRYALSRIILAEFKSDLTFNMLSSKEKRRLRRSSEQMEKRTTFEGRGMDINPFYPKTDSQEDLWTSLNKQHSNNRSRPSRRRQNTGSTLVGARSSQARCDSKNYLREKRCRLCSPTWTWRFARYTFRKDGAFSGTRDGQSGRHVQVQRCRGLLSIKRHH